MKSEPRLTLKVRILIGVIATPSLILATMLLSMIMNQASGDISFFEIIYSLVGVFAMYIALTGKKFF